MAMVNIKLYGRCNVTCDVMQLYLEMEIVTVIVSLESCFFLTYLVVTKRYVKRF